MLDNKIIKAFTFLSFLFFIGCFLAYRIGIFDPYFKKLLASNKPTSHNGGPINRISFDTIYPRLDTGLVKVDSSKVKKDSISNNSLIDSLNTITNFDSAKKSVEFFSSTKSAMVVDYSLIHSSKFAVLPKEQNLSLELFNSLLSRNLKINDSVKVYSDSIIKFQKDNLNKIDLDTIIKFNNIQNAKLKNEEKNIWPYGYTLVGLIGIVFLSWYFISKKNYKK